MSSHQRTVEIFLKRQAAYRELTKLANETNDPAVIARIMGVRDQLFMTG